MKSEAYAISMPIGKRNLEENRSFVIGLGIYLGSNCMLCLSSLVKSITCT